MSRAAQSSAPPSHLRDHLRGLTTQPATNARNSTVPDRGSARRFAAIRRSAERPGDWRAGWGRTDRRSGSSSNWCAGSRGPEQRFPVVPCSGRYIPCSGENKSLFGSSRESGCSTLKSLHELTPASAAMTGKMQNSLLFSLPSGNRGASKRSPD
jgi:hypothetical protein